MALMTVTTSDWQARMLMRNGCKLKIVIQEDDH